MAQYRNEIPSLLNENALSGMGAYASRLMCVDLWKVVVACYLRKLRTSELASPSRRAPVLEAFVTSGHHLWLIACICPFPRLTVASSYRRCIRIFRTSCILPLDGFVRPSPQLLGAAHPLFQSAKHCLQLHDEAAHGEAASCSLRPRLPSLPPTTFPSALMHHEIP
jgi:hypothetical protein